MNTTNPPGTSLVPVTTRAGYQNKHIYQILIDRLMFLERMLVGHGFTNPIPRIQFHVSVLKRLQETPGIDSDETLWSLVEATELADVYCTLPRLRERTIREKFSEVLSGPINPQKETTESNHARNTMFELYLAGFLSHQGVPTEMRHNPDLLCTVSDRKAFIQCKRPFSRKSVALNIGRACKQLSKDLNASGDARDRGVVAISLTHAINLANMHMEVKKENDLNTAIASQIRPLGDHLSCLIRGPRIIGLVFSVTTPARILDINEYRIGQLIAFYPSREASQADRAMLRHMFLRRQKA